MLCSLRREGEGSSCQKGGGQHRHPMVPHSAGAGVWGSVQDGRTGGSLCLPRGQTRWPRPPRVPAEGGWTIRGAKLEETSCGKRSLRSPQRSRCYRIAAGRRGGCGSSRGAGEGSTAAGLSRRIWPQGKELRLHPCRASHHAGHLQVEECPRGARVPWAAELPGGAGGILPKPQASAANSEEKIFFMESSWHFCSFNPKSSHVGIAGMANPPF